MRAEVRQRLTRSAETFKTIVWPRISPVCGGGCIEPVEGVTESKFTKTLDVLSGIDAWQIIDDLGIRGIASRVQWKTDYTTFTVRRSLPSGGTTEWQKNLKAAELAQRGFIRCHLVVQAYVTEPGGELIAAYVVKAPDLYSVCRDDLRGRPICRGTDVAGGVWFEPPPAPSGEKFAAFPVKALQRHGIRVRQVCADWKTDA